MYSVVLIVIMSVVTLCIRAFPFLVFNGKQALPAALEYLQKVLPMASMNMLVVYCLKSVDILLSLWYSRSCFLYSDCCFAMVEREYDSFCSCWNISLHVSGAVSFLKSRMV